MRPVREITAEEENFRAEPMFVDGSFPNILCTRRDPVKPEPEGTIILMAFKVIGYDLDCDRSLMARLEHINKDGKATGWEPDHLGLYPGSGLVVSLKELKKMFEEK